MKKFLTIFFVILGVIFFILILVGGYLYMALIERVQRPVPPEVEKKIMINTSQEKALQSIGIDPATIPSKITPEQEVCGIKILGETRAGEIKAGSAPTASEMFSLKGCM